MRLNSISGSSLARFLFLIPVLLLCGSLPGAARWQPLGPDGAGLGSAIVIDPSNPLIVYVGIGSGVYKSVDRGATWTIAARGLPAGAFSLAIDPEVPTTLYAAVSTGEISPTSRVYKTTDGAASWFPASCGLGEMGVRVISLDRRNPSRLYAASRMGVYRTLNGGLTWELANNGLANLDVQTVVAAPSQAGVVYAGTLGGVFRSSNGASSWQSASAGLGDVRVTLLAVSPTDDQVLLAGSFTAVSRSVNGGGSWQAAGQGLAGGTPFDLAFDPGNTSVVYAGTVLDGIYKSLNGGVNWSAANTGVTMGGSSNFGLTALAVDPAISSRVYAVTLDGGPGVLLSTNAGTSWGPSGQGLDTHRVLDVAIDPVDSRILYIIVDDRNGVYKSLDGGATWQRMTSGFRDSFGLFDNLPLSLAIDPRNRNNLYLGSNGDGLFRTSDGGASWQRVQSSLLSNRFLTKVVIDPLTSSVVYVSTSDGGVLKSVNGGGTFAATGNQIPSIVQDIDVDPTQTSRVYAITSAGGGVFRSVNGGSSWSQIATGLGGASPRQLVIDPSNSSILYLSTSGNGVFRSDNRGDTWTAVNNGLPELRTQALAAGPGVLYVGTFDYGVFRSRDRGQTWSRAASGLRNELIFSLVVDPRDPETVYAGPDGHGLHKRVERPAHLYAAGRVGTRPQFDGVAFSNFSLEGAALGLEQIEAGTPASTTDLALPAGRQVARTRGELFPGASNQAAWFEQTSDATDVASFFQFGSSDLSQLDGGVAVTEPLTEFLFTRVFEGATAFRGQRATTRLSIFNPNAAAVTVRLSYQSLAAPPGPPARQITRQIPGRTFLEGSFAQLFQTDTSGGYVFGEVTSGGGVVAFEVIHLPDRQTILGLNAADPAQPGRSYSAQLAAQAGLFTNINLINSGDLPSEVGLTAVREDGSTFGQRQTRTLAPGEQWSIDASTLFGSSDLVGSLVAESNGAGLVGDVIFGDPVGFRFAAALPMQTRAFTEAVFSQVANVSGFFTGLAFFYPGSPFESACAAPANITLEVVRADGSLAGMATRQLGVGQRLSQLVPELVPQSMGQAGGYVRIRSDRPVIAQMLFGVIDGQGIALFSAVPPAVVFE